MKTLQSFGLSAALLLAGLSAPAQDRPTSPVYSLGTSKTLVRQLETQVAATAARQGGSTVTLRVSAAKAFTGQVNYREDLAATGEYVVGEIAGVAGSSFFVRIEGKTVEGNIVLRATRQAYRYSADEQGNVSVQPVDINKVICIDYDKPVGYKEPAASSATNPANRTAVTSLQSLPGARGCVMLDFDGQYVSGTPWNNGNPINAASFNMTDANIQAFWELVSEDYRPFSVNITTDEAVFNSYPKTMRMRCIVTPTNTAAPGAGGVAYVGSFRSNNDTPCWVFMSSPKSGGDAASHEVGHTLGLSHDGRLSPREEYYTAQDNSGVWAPIMGASYYKAVGQWSKGEYNSASNKEDDLAIITSSTYNLGYRADDHSNATAGATTLARSGTSLTGNGIIERTTDQDYFTFTTGGGTASFNVSTVSRYGDLDIVARLFNSSGGLVGTYDTAGGGNLNVSFSTSLSAGTYYLSVDGAGSGNPATDGYSDYGSLGTFNISGTASAGGNTPPTGDNCGVATGLNASNQSNSGATVAWTAVSGATSYKVQYRVSGTSAWTSTTSTSTSQSLTGLVASTTYEFQVQAVCASGSSAFSASASFTTTGSTPPATYCASKGNNQNYEWIDWVSLGSINRQSSSDGGYYNGTAISTDIARGSTQTIRFSAGFASQAYVEYWNVYIDWNQNGVFTDAGELLISGGVSSAGTLTGTFTVPPAAKLGPARLRVVMSDNSATTSCGSYTYGETEDYTVNITGAAAAASAGPATAGLLTVYPNPATDQLNLVLPPDTEVLTVVVRDVRGVVVTDCRYENGQLNVTGLATGLYMVLVKTNQQTFVQRFVKQ